MTESGTAPRLMEVTREGKIAVEFPLKCQTANAHMETRMARQTRQRKLSRAAFARLRGARV